MKRFEKEFEFHKIPEFYEGYYNYLLVKKRIESVLKKLKSSAPNVEHGQEGSHLIREADIDALDLTRLQTEMLRGFGSEEEHPGFGNAML